MKTGTISIILALIGISFVIWFNFQTSEQILAEVTKAQSSYELSPILVSNGKLNKLIAIGIGIIGLLFGFKSVRNKSRTGVIGIILSICLLIMTFIPIWAHMISVSKGDIYITY